MIKVSYLNWVNLLQYKTLQIPLPIVYPLLTRSVHQVNPMFTLCLPILYPGVT